MVIMKELSIEEKAKRYDEKLDVARHIYADPSVKYEDKYYIDVIFPELAESEDERISKEIIDIIDSYPISQLRSAGLPTRIPEYIA